jgi:hypothetical protein
MHRFRHASSLIILALVSLLYCTQICVAAGHATAAVTVPTHDPADARSCHPPAEDPQHTNDQCADCGTHFFLASPSSGGDALSAAVIASSFVLLFTYPSDAQESSPLVFFRRPERHLSPPPLYLALSVLRL